MTVEHSFALIPFPAPMIPAISVTGNLILESSSLTLRYSVGGEIEEVCLPAISQKPARRDELWKATCFEFFLALKDRPGYWEFNMSPSGDWNIYRMDAYRRIGFREEAAMPRLPFEFKKTDSCYLLDASVDLTPIIQPGQDFELAITAIIQTKGGRETYWALAHSAPQADFHAREGFILKLAGQNRPLEESHRDG